MGIAIDLWVDVMNKYVDFTLKSFKNKLWLYFDDWRKFVQIDIKRKKERNYKMISDKEIFIVEKIFYRIKEIQRVNKNKNKYI